MAFNTLEYLKEGKVDFVFSLPSYDYDNLIEYVRKASNRIDIINGFLDKLMDKKSDFCLKIIYDIEEYKFETSKLLAKYGYSFFDSKRLKNVLYNTSWGRDFIKNNLEELISCDDKSIYVIFKYIFEDIDKNKDFIELFYVHEDLHIRYLFMKHIITHNPKLINEIYGDIANYLIDEPLYKQLSFIPELDKNELMDVKDASSLAVQCLSVNDKENWIKLKEYILSNYKENSIASSLLFYGNSKQENLFESEFIKDSDRLFKTSLDYRFSIYRNYGKNVSKELIDDFYNKVKYFKNDKTLRENWTLDTVYFRGLGTILEECVLKYLELSKDKTYEYLTSGSMSSCYRIGDYVFKLCKQKWSYEDIICPNLYIILKNLEEYFSRNEKGVVNAGIEIQKYLTRSAKSIEPKYFQKLTSELDRLGYFCTDSLINGKCGDNCMLLDSYKDADCENPEELPDWFKEVPLVIVDRDRIYEKGRSYVKQLREGY